MELETRTSGPVDVLEVRGKLVGDPGATRLREKVDELLREGDPAFVINLNAVTEMDSTFIGELVACREHVRKQGGVMKLVLNGRPYDLFLATRLDFLFEIFHDEPSALGSFGARDMTAGIP